MTFKEKIKNIWDYDKWFIIGGLVLIIALGYFAKDVIFKEKFDYTVVYAAEGYLSEDELQNFNDVMATFAEDLDKNGKTNVKIINIEFPPEGTVGGQILKEKNTLLMTELALQENCIFIIEEEKLLSLYENNTDAFLDLSTLSDEIPEGTKYIKLNQTELKNKLPMLDDELILVLRVPYLEKYLDIYESCRNYVARIIE